MTAYNGTSLGTPEHSLNDPFFVGYDFLEFLFLQYVKQIACQFLIPQF